MPSKLLWLDLEMTGLDVDKEVIIEVAAIVTDYNFMTLDRYHSVVMQPQKYLDGMDEWNTKHHGMSGLTQKVPNGKPPEQVEQELSDLIKRNFTDEPATLAGNSIGQDRFFLKVHFKAVEKLLHYRMLDVSSWKIIFKEKFHFQFEKSNNHRALDDIQESIDELRCYIDHIKI
ncbi:MAG: oligoribonuclease [Bdellovibrionaceae bacterium]|jgi:oligoribonuclease|nr:oligoribonuclease [Pseudobdellovibrionaceae bacterium]